MMMGHPSEHLVWAPDSCDDVAFNLYAMECEQEDAAQEAREVMRASGHFFSSANDLGVYLQLNAPSAYTQLSDNDIIDLWYNQ